MSKIEKQGESNATIFGSKFFHADSNDNIFTITSAHRRSPDVIKGQKSKQNSKQVK